MMAQKKVPNGRTDNLQTHNDYLAVYFLFRSEVHDRHQKGQQQCNAVNALVTAFLYSCLTVHSYSPLGMYSGVLA